MNVRQIGARPDGLGERIVLPPSSARVVAIDPPKSLAPLARLNTRAVGFGGVLVSAAAGAFIALEPSLARSLGGHVPPLWLPAVAAVLGSVASLLGRWRTFYE